MNFVKKMLMRFARKVMQGVMSQLSAQLNVVQNQAYAPMQAMMRQVSGGDVWVGRGADQFVQEVQEMFMPNTSFVSGFISSSMSNLNRAMDIMDQADQAVNSMVGGLADTFGNIF